MYLIDKFIERISRLFRFLLSKDFILNHKFQNKNQVTNANFIINSLKKKNFFPSYIFDIGCGHGEWTKKLLKFYPNSNFFLFDADNTNLKRLENLKKKYPNINYKICLLSDNESFYTFYNMGYGSSIFEEQTSHIRKQQKIKSIKLKDEIPNEFRNYSNNLIKIDVQGAELKVLEGLDESINNFEVIILEVSIHQYNKDAPLFDQVLSFMIKKNFKLYDIFDLKRLGNDKSFLLQFDCIFVRNDSKLLKVNF
jgi:FkbM family methyltransferase